MDALHLSGGMWVQRHRWVIGRLLIGSTQSFTKYIHMGPTILKLEPPYYSKGPYGRTRHLIRIQPLLF